MDNQVIRDPAIKQFDSYRVIFNDRLCSPSFNSKGAAAAYLDMLVDGRRKPEFRIMKAVAMIAACLVLGNAPAMAAVPTFSTELGCMRNTETGTISLDDGGQLFIHQMQQKLGDTFKWEYAYETDTTDVRGNTYSASGDPGWVMGRCGIDYQSARLGFH